MKRKANMAEKRHMAYVSGLGCIVCELCLQIPGSPSEVHHVRARHGWGRSSHYAVIPLCRPHHRDSGFGVHDMGREQFEQKYGYSEIELLAIVNARMGVVA